MRNRLLKTLLVLFALSFLWNPETHSQTIYGFKAGLNISTPKVVDGNRSTIGGEISSAVGFNAGFLTEFIVNEWLSIGVQLNYDQRGSSYTEERFILGERQYIDGKINTGYMELPLLAKFRTLVNKKKKQGIYGAVGPGFSYLIHGNIKGTKTVGSESYPINEKITGDMVSSNFGITFAAGIFLPMERSRIMFELRYFQGLTNDFSGSDEYPSEELDSYGRVFSINVVFTSVNHWVQY